MELNWSDSCQISGLENLTNSQPAHTAQHQTRQGDKAVTQLSPVISDLNFWK